MRGPIPFLHFSGNCEEALHFYKECFGGEIVAIQRYSDSPGPVPEEHETKILYSQFKAGDLLFMASDGPPNFHTYYGNQVSLNINFDSPVREEKIFKSLSFGGTIDMPLEDQFWGAKSGMLTDKYGIKWMLNCDKPKQ